MLRIKLGPSQKAVYDWLIEHPWSSPQQIGDAIYDQTSCCAPGSGYGPVHWPEEKVRRLWAAKLLTILVKKGCVVRAKQNTYLAVPDFDTDEIRPDVQAEDVK